MKNKAIYNFITVISVISWTTSLSAQYISGNTYFGANNYIEYHAGDLPIIISAPHGGYLTPASIPDRNCSGCVTSRDSRTEELIYEIDSAIQILFGGHPHIIINKLARIKLDANRSVTTAANGNTSAQQAWTEYHDFIQTAKDSSVKHFGTALYIDLHAHAHTIQRIEIGYLLNGSELRNTDATLNALNFQDSSSIKHLANVLNPTVNFSNLLRGSKSMGQLLENAGYPSTPSFSDPAPLLGDPYFAGGYNTVRHGSRDSSKINSMQFELNWTGLRNSVSNREKFADALACAIREYLDYWFFDLDSWSPGHVVTTNLDEGPGSLRDVLLGVEDGDVISFSPSLSGDTIRLKKELLICNRININGPGANLIAISGQDSSRIFRVMNNDTALIRGLSLVHGRAPTGKDGGAIVIYGALQLSNCIISNNFSDDDGGAVYVTKNGLICFDSCSVKNNQCADNGGAIYNLEGKVIILNSNFESNVSSSKGGAISSSGEIVIHSSSFISNQTNIEGGAIRAFKGTLNAINSTFASNLSNNRGAAISTFSATSNLNFCSVVNNTSAIEGAGIEIDSSICTLKNTLVANNSANSNSQIFNTSGIGNFISNGFNFISDTTGSGWNPNANDQLGNTLNILNPITLLPMNNGGNTITVALDIGSPCIDAADSSLVSNTDQIGTSRINNGLPDIGAYEVQWSINIAEYFTDRDTEGQMSIYPNPAQNQITIDLKKKGDYQIIIRNSLGMLIHKVDLKSTESKRIDISSFAAGVYWAQVKGSISETKTFIVE